MRYYNTADRGRLGFPFIPLIALATSVMSAKKSKSDAKAAAAMAPVAVYGDGATPAWVKPALLVGAVAAAGLLVYSLSRRPSRAPSRRR